MEKSCCDLVSSCPDWAPAWLARALTTWNVKMKMKPARLLLALLSTVTIAPVAFAQVLPAGSTFTGGGLVDFRGGPLLVVKGCSMSLSGQTDSNGSNVMVVNSVSFSGNSICQSIVPKGLPWKLEATSLTTMAITGVDMTFLGINCGGSASTVVQGSWSNSAGFSAVNQSVANCRFDSLQFTTSPQLTVQ